MSLRGSCRPSPSCASANPKRSQRRRCFSPRMIRVSSRASNSSWTAAEGRSREFVGAGVLSYLLFERGYCRHLVDLGFADGMSRREEILDFLGYGARLIENRAL